MNQKAGSDHVRPGEQWFFYWKTSAALWESRILETPAHEVIFIPLYWGFHAENDTSWDFGEYHPERDLWRLTQTLTQHGRKFCWVLPLTPSPFLPNGGVPPSAARTLSTCREGVHLGCLDQEEKLNKMYSYFEPKVFQAFSQFLTAFGNFLATRQIKAPLWGVQFYYSEEGRTISFIEDSSLAFDQGFSRFLRKNHPEGIEINDPHKEEEIKNSFGQEVQNLFSTTAESLLSPFWKGVQKIVVLGSGPHETIERALPCGKSQLSFFQDIFSHYVRDQWISSSLLRPSEKKDLLPAVIHEHFGRLALEERFQYRASPRELSEEWKPFEMAGIFDDEKRAFFTANGLTGFLDGNYQWMYQLHEELNFTSDWIESHQHQIKFFHASLLDRTRFGQALKLFLMGQTVVIDKEGLSPELERRLQVFFLENNLNVQMVNYITSISLTELGDGRLIVFEGDKLKASPDKKKFWGHLFKFFRINHPEVTMDKDVFGLWRIRATSSQDLNFLDVRRLTLYNPTSYKKLVSVHTHGHFAFMKAVDPERSQVKSNPQGVEVELLPSGKVSVDFGHYEEA